MTPIQKIKATILMEADLHSMNGVRQEITDDNVDSLFELANQDWALQDSIEEFRTGGEASGLPCEYSRHYESSAVARQVFDGSWVGWTYWYGGGKHGEPEAVDWMEHAYQLDVEEERLVVVRTFSLTEVIK